MTTVRSVESVDKPLVFAKCTKVMCVGIACVLLVAGLAPFHAPKNNVKWLANGNGLQFRRYSSILSASAFRETDAKDPSESIELWLVPRSLRSTNAIVSFDGSDHPGAAFIVRQYKDALVVRQYHIDDKGVTRVEWLAVSKAFREATSVLVTVTLGKKGTAIYLDGVIAETFASRGRSTNNLTGRLVVANSPAINDSWPGQILGLAIYRSQLTASQVAEHYTGWTKAYRPLPIRQGEAAVALYLFNEGEGNIVRNQLHSGSDLIIPQRYFVLHPQFLSSVMRDYRRNWQYWQDIALNISGFVPLGLFVTIYFSEVRAIKHPAVGAVIVGLLISLTIECLQVFLPTRSSGLTDVVTNTLGTAMGVIICRSSLVQSVLTKIRQCDMSSAASDEVKGVRTDPSNLVAPSTKPISLSA